MHILYADESGNTRDSSQEIFVLGGFSIFERQGFWISSELDKILQKIFPSNYQEVELHGSHMWNGRGIWRSIPKTTRLQIIIDSLQVLASSHDTNRVFIIALKKSRFPNVDIVEEAFTQLSTRFDHLLTRYHNKKDEQRGIIIFDKTTYENALQRLTTVNRATGCRWGKIKNLAEVPLFIDSRASRLTQLADLVAYSAFRNYEKGDSKFYSIIRNKIDADNGVIHGLYEKV